MNDLEKIIGILKEYPELFNVWNIVHSIDDPENLTIEKIRQLKIEPSLSDDSILTIIKDAVFNNRKRL
jgi:hypothetical protein